MPGEPQFWQDAAVIGVQTCAGAVRAKKTVVAAGAWLPQMLDPVGIECFVKAKKRQVFNVKVDSRPLKELLHNREFSDAASFPFMVLPQPSIYIRPNLVGEGFGVGIADGFPRAFQAEDHPKPEADFYTHGLHPVIAKYLPQFRTASASGGFAGLYAINTLDEQPIIFLKITAWLLLAAVAEAES